MQLDSLTDRRTTSIFGKISEEEKFKGIRFPNCKTNSTTTSIKILRPFWRKEMISGSLRGHLKHSGEPGKRETRQWIESHRHEISPRWRAQRKSSKNESFLVVVHVDAFGSIKSGWLTVKWTLVVINLFCFLLIYQSIIIHRLLMDGYLGIYKVRRKRRRK